MLPSKAEIMQALESVHDPHVPVSLHRMGMLREIEISEDGVVNIQVCIPCRVALASVCFVKISARQCSHSPVSQRSMSKRDGIYRGHER